MAFSDTARENPQCQSTCTTLHPGLDRSSGPGAGKLRARPAPAA